MTASEDQAEAERAIFIEFAATVPLAVNSMESRPPPGQIYCVMSRVRAR